MSQLGQQIICVTQLLAEQELAFRLGEFISVELIRDKRSQCCLFQFFLDISDRVPLALLSPVSPTPPPPSPRSSECRWKASLLGYLSGNSFNWPQSGVNWKLSTG